MKNAHTEGESERENRKMYEYNNAVRNTVNKMRKMTNKLSPSQ